ncbi:hypothetical protein [Magnetospirillum sp. UT-4]|uniref:hypothetical protein n=1 Tax=Magnetospirillum sp. UT-4 TaxID=2681467 RepID=UPI00137EFD36|nr:hypothetical protein [Magnetospirillum sp. UT-4]CAA7621800.1 conserved hypothetical protein [Magnetospirillum sp. UT-4]
MPLTLRTSRDLPAAGSWRHWLAVTGTPGFNDAATRLPDLERRLERAFEDSSETWWRLGRAHAADPGGALSHTVACGAFGSDFGLMLAWVRLAGELAAGSDPVLMLCDDPWLFRRLAALPGVQAGAAPPLALTELKLRLRGFAARGLLALRLARSAVAARRWRGAIKGGDPVLLVYGHPASRADGFDAYFGTLMAELPETRRLLHTDCPPPRAALLAADGRTASLHGWGSALFALTMPLWSWRPRRREGDGADFWLLRRAAMRENGGGGPAMNRWQMHCQRRFLAAVRPRVACWPWENHGWERDLARAARTLGIRTVGYQHTVIGRHQINYAIHANADGAAALPDLIAADGPAYLAELAAWGVPKERLGDAGAWRIQPLAGRPFDPDGPVFVPLSAIPAVAERQVEAAGRIAATGRQVLVKEHPMYPLDFADRGCLRRTQTGIGGHAKLSAVLYATGASGLEALLLGLPAFRLLLADRISIDVLPAGIEAEAVTLDDLPHALEAAGAPPPLPYGQVLSPVDMGVWKRLLNGDMHPFSRR